MINARLYFNGDDCFLCWATPPISNCWGFAIRRNLVTADGKHSFCEFEAPSAAACTELSRRAGLPTDAVVPLGIDIGPVTLS